MMFPRTLLLLLSFFGVLAACRCGAVPKPAPVTVTIGDATIPIEQQVCANLVAFCPSSVPDGGEQVCEMVVRRDYGLKPALFPSVLVCEAQAMSRDAFVSCGGVSNCGGRE